MKQSFVLSMVLMTVLVGCGGPSSSTKGDSSVHTLDKPAAMCQVMAPGSVVVVCIDFIEDSPNNQTACTTAEQAEYAPEGANGSVYLAVQSGGTAIASCASTNSKETALGTCAMVDRAIRYYPSEWKLAAAQANCQSLAGAWRN